jgi:hypothetical protein
VNRYTIENNGQRFVVEAPDEASAMRAISSFQPQQPAPVQGPPTLGDTTQRQIGQGNRVLNEAAAFGRGAVDTATFGLSDELGAASAAINPVSALIDWISGSGRTMGDRYNQSLETSRAAAKSDEQDRWGARLGGQVAGALAIPIGAGVSPVRAAEINARIPGAAVAASSPITSAAGLATLGAGTGAAYGFGSGEGMADRTGQAITGGLIGGVAAPVLGKAINTLGAGLDASATVAQGLRGFARASSDPAEEAARRTGNALRVDMRTSGRSAADVADDMRAMQATGAPAVIADAGGNASAREMRRAINLSPEAGNIGRSAVDSRFVTQVDRGTQALREAAPDTAFAAGGAGDDLLNSLRTRMRAENSSRYNAAYGAPQAQSVWDDTLSGLVEAPAVRDAIRHVMKNANNYAVAEGHRGRIRNPFVETADGIAIARQSDGATATPNLQFWDYTKRALDDQVSALFRAGRNDEAGIVKSLRDQLRSHLDNIVPQYGQARSGAARLFGAEDAYEAGQNLVSSRMQNAEMRRAFSALPETEKKLFREGFVDNLSNSMREVGTNRDQVITSAFSSPAARERIEIALGPQGAARMEMWLRHENIMQNSNRIMTGNSTTAQQAGDMANSPMPGSAMEVVRMVAAQMRGEVNERVANEVARLMTSSNPRDIERILEAASKQPQVREFMRRLDAGLARLVGSGSGGTANTLSPSVIGGVIGSRAEEDRPR